MSRYIFLSLLGNVEAQTLYHLTFQGVEHSWKSLKSWKSTTIFFPSWKSWKSTGN